MYSKDYQEYVLTVSWSILQRLASTNQKELNIDSLYNGGGQKVREINYSQTWWKRIEIAMQASSEVKRENLKRFLIQKKKP